MKAIIIVICILFSDTISGQKHRVSVNYKPSLTYFGKQKESFNNAYFDSRSGNKTFNNSANILYSYKVLSKFNLTTGVEFSQQGQNINFKTNSVIPENSNVIFWTKLHYVRIPVTVGYSVFKKKNSEIYITTGLSLGFAAKREDNYNGIINEYILLPPPEKRYEEQDWAIPIEINYQKTLSKNFVAIFGFEYLIGLTNSFNENAGSKFGVLSEFDNSKQKRLAINIGIGFNLKK